ncbi:DMT family transporter [Peribacillus tepidiphilus]|uniref:DMT family transporter n=1 Tax=Peribacillus tepidiphilus TaxID=2652445 RepID=UPI001291E11D|nr:EamA family transporter [Peribacillus tepidiphilus]
MKKSYAVLFIVLAAIFWGIIGIFVKGLTKAGFTAMEIVTIRVIISSVLLLILGAMKYKSQLKISYKDAHLFIGTGILSIVFFNWCYFSSINRLSISTAVILLYTAPVFVMVLSALFLGEKFTFKKFILLALTIVGCGLVAEVSVEGIRSGDLLGYLIGLGAGLGYALYSIFGKLALRKYQSFTITLYTFIVASVFLLPITGIWNKADRILNGNVIVLILGLGTVSTVLAYLLYTSGLQTMESSKASILTTVEPVAAMLVGFIVFNESIQSLQLTGAILILGALIFYNLPERLKKKQNVEEIK